MDLRPLSIELQRKAQEELNEDPKRLRDDLEHIRKWLQKQPHLRARTEDQWLISFLRGCKFSLEKTKDKLDFFYTMRTLAPEIFANRDPFLPEIQEILKAGVIFPLSKTNGKLGARIIMVYYKNLNVNKMSLQNIVKVYFMLCEILMLEDDDSVVSGIYGWSDFYKLPLSFIMQFTPVYVKKMMLSVQHAYPLRIKGIYGTSVAPVFESTFNMAKSLLNKKLQKRMCLVSEMNFEKIYDLIPKEFHPTDMGGSGGYVREIAAHWKEKVESYQEWFLESEKYGTDESKRQVASKYVDDIFGTEGSFRKLNID